MRKAMAILLAHKNQYNVYEPDKLTIVTKDFCDVDFTDLVKDRRYYTLAKMFKDVVNIAKANNFIIESAGTSNKIPNILFSDGNSKFDKYIFRDMQ